jgi:hypothetical protein
MADRQEICDWLSSLALVIVTDALDAGDLATRLAAAPALSSADFALESINIMRVIAESTVSPADFDALRAGSFTSDETIAAGSVLLSIGLCIAGGRASWISRPQARAGRQRIVDMGDTALAVVSAMGADGVDLYSWLTSLINISVRLVSDQAANAVPVVRVDTGISLPSSYLAYQLYGDASRAESLVEIGGSSTPMLMPAAFNALER